MIDEDLMTTKEQYNRLLDCGLSEGKGYYSLADLLRICKLRYPPETELCFCSQPFEEFGSFAECEPYDTDEYFRIEYDDEYRRWQCPCFCGKFPSGETLIECLVQVIELMHACEIDL